MFGKKQLEEENERLKADLRNLQAWVEEYKVLDAIQIADETARLSVEHDQVASQVATQNENLLLLQQQVVETNEIAILQEVGIYQVRHRLEDAVAYKNALSTLKDNLKELIATDQAVAMNTGWQVDGSVQKGMKMQRDIAKLMLRAYNSEADTLVRTMRPYMLESATKRLTKAYETIAKLGSVVKIRVTEQYHEQRLYELELTADYLVKSEEEKERIREERAQERDEAKARKELEAERERLDKERNHYESALAKLAVDADPAARAELEAKLAEIDDSIQGVEEREANIRAGYVYIISNIGAFGDHVVKIGLTRRLDPMDRVRELGDASVPFRFDVHAIIFSNDAVTLEATLHESLADLRVNQVNPRREFFYATPEQVRDVLANLDGEFLLEYHEFPEAYEWRESGGSKRLADLGIS
jgi:hypothetical protein